MRINKHMWMSILLFSCNHLTINEQRINQTIEEVVNSIKVNNYLGVIDKIATEYVNFDTMTIKLQVLEAYYLLTKSSKREHERLKWSTNGYLDNLGRMKYTSTIYKGFDSLTGIKHAVLNLYVGPPETIPLDKLSGFDIDFDIDYMYRRQLDISGKLLDIEKIIDSINK